MVHHPRRRGGRSDRRRRNCVSRVDLLIEIRRRHSESRRSHERGNVVHGGQGRRLLHVLVPRRSRKPSSDDVAIWVPSDLGSWLHSRPVAGAVSVPERIERVAVESPLGVALAVSVALHRLHDVSLVHLLFVFG